MTQRSAPVAVVSVVLSCAEVAQALGASEYWVAQQVRRRRFPHLRVGRKVRFTVDHLERIRELLEVSTADFDAGADGRAVAPPGDGHGAAVGGLTSRSRRRLRAAAAAAR